MLLRNSLQITRVFATIAIAVLWAGSAWGQYNLPMTNGAWFQNRGPLVDIPVNGGPVPCGTLNAVSDGCVGPFRPANGGIANTSMAEVVVNAGAAPGDPAQMTIPPNVFAQANGFASTHVSIIPTVVQFDTNHSLRGPMDQATHTGVNHVRILGGMTSAVSTVGNRVFQKDAWMAQSGRLGQTFSWCPEVPGGMCADPRPSVNGGPVPSVNGRVVYSNPDGNGYGGSMNLLTRAVDASGSVWVAAGTTGGVALLLRQINLTNHRQHPGGQYATMDLNFLVTGPIFLGFMTSMQTPGQSGASLGQTGMITGIGSQVATAPADTTTNWGFPWTTGMVLVSNKDTTPTTITVTGSDMRTQAGAGQITMVAGGMSHRITSGANYMPVEVVTFTLPEPGSALMLGVSLSLIFGLYRVSRRR